MNTVVDTEGMIQQLRAAGVPEDQARAHVHVILEAQSYLAHQGDLAVLRNELHADNLLLRADVVALGNELRAEMKQVRTELSADLKQLRTELTGAYGALRTELTGANGSVRTELEAFRTHTATNFTLFALQITTDLKAWGRRAVLTVIGGTGVIISIGVAVDHYLR